MYDIELMAQPFTFYFFIRIFSRSILIFPDNCIIFAPPTHLFLIIISNKKHVNQLHIGGMDKKEALVETGKTCMRPILMTAMTTILAMSTMAFSNDMGFEMGKDMAVVVIGGLIYGTFMTLFIVPVLYDIIYRKKDMKKVDIGDEESLKDDEVLLAVGINDIGGNVDSE